MKAYTDIIQSFNLAKILSLDTADMRYGYRLNKEPFIISDRIYDGGYSEVPYMKDFFKKNLNVFEKKFYDGELHAWSLSALLSLLPRPTLHQTNDGKWYCDITDNRTYFSKHYDNPIDACYEMILKLHDHKIL